MALPISSPARPQLHSQDTLRPASSSQLSVDVAAHRRRSPSCSLTIFKGIAGAHISAHNPIVSKPAGPQPPAASNRGGGRFAGSFAGLGQHQASPQGGNDEAVNVHAVTDDGILLPFIDRPTEVEELLFDTKTNEPLLQRLCRVFGGSLQQPTRRGISEAWDELLEILVGTDRAILDDEDWLVRLETIIMDRSAELWGQLQRCLGADGLLLDASAHASVVRYDSWADGDARSDGGSDSPGSEPATPISEALPSSSSVEVDVRALYELPPSYYKQPVGKLRRPSMHDDHAEASLDAPSLSPRALRDQITSPSSPSLHLGEPLADIMEEPPKAGAVPATRPRSYSGKFAGLRIQAGPQHGARSPSTSSLSPGMGGRTSNPSSPLPTGVMSPAGPQRGGSALSPGAVDPSSAASTSFSHPRRLSLLAPAGGGGEHARHHHHRPDQQQGHHHRQQLHDTRDKALRADHPHPYGASSHGHSPTPSSLFDGHRQPRRRAMSFARSFAHLHSAMPTEASGSELAKQRAPAAAAERPRFRHQKSHSISHGEGISALEKPDAPAAPPQGLGLLPDGRTQHPSAGASSRARAMSMANPDTGHGLSPFPDHAERTRSTSDKTADSSSASIPGLLPDGRTRHPSGSQGSKDLSESIAAFRATMGLSTSPSGGARNEIKEESPAATVSEQRSRSRSRSRSSSPVSKPAAAAAATAPSTSPKGKAASRPSSHLPQSSPYYQQSAEAGSQPRQGAPSAGGSGLALGGGFSLAKSGANFKRPDAGPVRSLSNGSLGVSAREQDEADAILAEEGYGERWEAFAALCHALGVGQFEIGLAKRRCGPAIELVGSAAGP
ncbi:uncharacterized protein PFL1_01147 [Pseudozyma flocculosa PF-1]|uniref:uncharacterized protein n=1 Tax=Pseudozyma flocculosa PF-1 TaxID=1277687 RepID=UPI000456027B|nr:uncharacterized protein PFL1_01147 [Pseudozyma flocculosa PF-1]EPQ30958.1 hypothetical protein PFL1_01147 [Pseudozyma flocculosa PF-1]